MTIQDDRTTNFSLKKPYPSNLLADDVLRLREALDAIDAALQARPTSSSVQGVVDAAVAALVASAPTTLDTLNELAAALGDDANFSTTVTNALAARLELAGGTMTGDLTLAGDPSAALQAATKQYVDAEVAVAQSTADSKASKSGDTFTGSVNFQAIIGVEGIRERVAISSSTSGTQNVSVLSEAIVYLTSAQTANRTVNLRGDSSTTLDSVMATGESVTVAILATMGATAYRLTTLQVDGTNVTVKWQNGSAPTSGNANSVDSYTFTVIKTGANAFAAFGALSQFA